MSDYKRLDRNLRYQGKIVEFYCDTMEMPNGNQAEWDYIHHKGAAAVIPVLDDGRIIMVRQYRAAIEKYTLEIPAGGLDPNENMKDCAARELEEETGFSSDHVEHLIDVYAAPAYSDEKIGIYYAVNLTASKQNLDENEFVEVERYTLDELTALILDGTIEDGKTISAILAYRAKMKQ